MALTPGTRIGVYDVTGQIGEGGMGQVYRATDTKLKRQVAIKILPPSLAADPDRIARFQREAEVLASLNHPNIAAIYGLEDADPSRGSGQAAVRALVMELVEGPTLADRIAQGPVPIAEALPIARQLADALEAAHEQGIIHRDLKPANIKLRPDGAVKVLDFGLAKAFGPPDASMSGGPTDRGRYGGLTNSPTLMTPAMTMGGAILGTAAYMSPEQAKGKAVDKRADVWAFGVVLFELLTGQVLFEGETVSETLASVIKDEPQLDRLPAATPPGVRRLLRRCLDRDSKLRLRDIGEARIELRRIESGVVDSDATVPPVGSALARRTPIWWIAATAVVTLVAAALAAWVYLQPALKVEVTRFTVPAPEMQAFATGPGLLALSPDGRRLVFATGAPDKLQLWIRPLDSLVARPIPGTDGAWQPFWSPDGRFIAFSGSSGPVRMKKIDVAGGQPVTMADGVTERGAWSPQGFILFTGADNRLYRMAEAGGQAVPVTELDKTRQENEHAWPLLLPDGRRFIYLAISRDNSKNALFLATLDSPVRTHLVDVNSSAEYGAGHLLYQREGTVMAQPFDEKNGRLTGEAVPIVENVAYNATNGRAALSVSGGVLAYRAGDSEGAALLAWFDRTGKRVSAIGSAIKGAYDGPRLSPDGHRLVVRRFDPGSHGGDLWLIDLDRGIPTRFTSDGADEASPVWSPDGSRIVFASNRKGVFDLYQRTSSGTTPEQVLYESPEEKEPTGFSPDGKLLLFTRRVADGRSDVWALPLTGNPTPFPFFPASSALRSDAVFSPDGHSIAYVVREDRMSNVFAQPFPANGQQIRLSATTGQAPMWTADGRKILYVTSDRHYMVVDVTTFGGTPRAGPPQELFAQVQRQTRGFAADADGQRFVLVVRPEQDAGALSPITVVLNWAAGLPKKQIVPP